MSQRILADTNVLLRRIQYSHAQHQRTRAAITGIQDRGDVLCITAQNLIECWAVCTRPVENNGLGLSTLAADQILARIEAAFVRLADDRDAVYRTWRELVVSYGVSGKKCHDARLVAAMKVHGISQILTFNAADFQRFHGITVITPAG